jgi:SAM-dependent methyltransferase
VKRTLLRLLVRARLLAPTFSLYERVRGLGASAAASEDDLPLPPRRLVVKVAGTGDMEWFVRGGALAAQSIRDLVPMDEVAALLDFGCGCGRVMRHWADLDAERAGTDVNADAIEWCRENLPFAQFETNALTPPLPFAGERFDLVYALSVFTHLTEPLQREWLDELRRVLRTGGRLVLSTHGDAYRDRLDDDERARYDHGDVVVRWEQVVGTNLCAAYHPRGSLERLADGFAFVEHVPEGAKGNPRQDLTLLRKV